MGHNGYFNGYSLCFQVMQKSCRCGFMYGELTDKETIARIEECLEGQIHDQFEILLYKKTSKFTTLMNFCMWKLQCGVRGFLRENRRFLEENISRAKLDLKI